MDYTKLKIKALAQFLNTKDVVESKFSVNTFEVYNKEFTVLTNEQAEREVRAGIEDSLWAFNVDFIAAHSGGKLDGKDAQKAFQAMQEKLCENANPIVRAMIVDFDAFVKDAIASDGRGHFLSFYDGEENEVKVDGKYLYIYRAN